jgi:hypothetical protein
VLEAVVVEYPGSGFASQDHVGAGVPWLIASMLQAASRPLGGPCQIDGLRSKHPDPLRVMGESFG